MWASCRTWCRRRASTRIHRELTSSTLPHLRREQAATAIARGKVTGVRWAPGPPREAATGAELLTARERRSDVAPGPPVTADDTPRPAGRIVDDVSVPLAALLGAPGEPARTLPARTSTAEPLDGVP